MPLYEYQCDACSVRFERIQKFSDPLVDTCPTCGGAVQKLISSPAIQFKGSGFYITDYARKSETPATSTGSGESSEAKSSKDGESKGSESKGGESKSGDSKSGESKSSSNTASSTDAKPATPATPAASKT